MRKCVTVSRRNNRRSFQALLAAAVAGVAGLAGTSFGQVPDTAVTFLPGSTELGTATNYSSNLLPGTTNDLVFTSGGGYTTTALTLSASNITPGTIDDLDATGDAFTITGADSITLSSLQNSVSGTPADLLYVASNASLTIGTNVILGVTGGNFDIASGASATISGQVSSGTAGNSLTQTGSGTLTLSSAQEGITGRVTVNGGTLILANANVGSAGLAGSTGLVINNGGTVVISNDNGLSGSTNAAPETVPVTINAGGTLTGLATADAGAGPTTHLWGLLTLNGGTLTTAGTGAQAAYGTWDLNGGVATSGGSATSTIAAPDVVPDQTTTTVFYVPQGTTTSGIDLNVTGNFIKGTSNADTGITKYGSGVMQLDSSTGSTYTGVTNVSSGTLVLNFEHMGASANIISASSELYMSGGALSIIGNPGSASAQTFNTYAQFTGGNNVISVSGTVAPTVNIGTYNESIGSTIEFIGPAYYNNASGTTNTLVMSTGSIDTTQTGTLTQLLWPYRQSLATVGLYDWASSATATPLGTNRPILAGSQVSGFYTTVAANGNWTSADANEDMLGGNQSSSSSGTVYTDTMRYNTPTTSTFTTVGSRFYLGGLLITPNVAEHNVTIAGNTNIAASAAGYNSSFDVYQNNTGGELTFNAAFTNPSSYTTAYAQAGAGLVILTNSGSSNTGKFYLNGGVTEVTADGDFSTPATANGLVLGGGTVLAGTTFTLGNTGVSNPRPISLVGSGGGLAAVAGASLTIDGQITGAAHVGPLIIGIPASAANGDTPGLVPSTGSGTPNAALYGTGTVYLTYANGTNGNAFYDGAVVEAGATANINSMYDLGGGDYQGLTLNNGTLQYNATLATGAAGLNEDVTTNGTTAQAFTLLGNGTIDVNGHAISYANILGNSGSGSLYVQNSNVTAGTLTLNGGTNFTGGLSVVLGGLVLNGVSVYTGATTVNNGAFLTVGSLSTATLGNTAITVNTGGTAAFKPGSSNIQIGSGTASSPSASLTVSGGGTVNIANGNNAFGTVTLNKAAGIGTSTGLALNGSGTTTSTEATLGFDIGATTSGGALTADELIVNNGAVSFGTTGAYNLIKLLTGSNAPADTAATVALISAPNGGLPSIPSTNFTILPNVAWGTETFTTALSESSNTLYLTLTPFTGSLNYFYTASTSDNIVGGAGNNFSTDATGATSQYAANGGPAAPGASNNLIFTATSSGDVTPVLDSSVTVNSLAFTGTGSAAASPVVLSTGGYSSSNAITLSPTSAFSIGATNYALGIGLVEQSGSAGGTISTNVVLGSSQTWEIDGTTAPLAVSGNISGTGALLTKTGAGVLLLGGSNSYTGGTTINNGTVQLGSANALPTTGILTVQGTGALDLNGNNASTPALTDGGVSTGTVTDSGPAATLTATPTAPYIFSGTISGSLGLTFNGTAAETLSGANSYTGLTSISSGTLNAASSTALGYGTVSTNGLAMSGSGVVNFTGATSEVAYLTGSAGNTIYLGGSTGTGTPTSLTIGAGQNSSTTNTYAGTIADQTTAGKPAGLGSLTVAGSGTVILSGTNTFGGTTSITGGTLLLANSLALQDSTLNYNNQGGTVNFGSQTAISLGGLSGAENLALTNASSGAVAATIGANNSAETYTGTLGGLGSVDKVGSGTLIIGSGSTGGATYGGNTTIDQGTLVIGGNSNIVTGVVDVTGLYGASNLTITDSGIVTSTTQVRVCSADDGNSGSYPTSSSLTVSGNAVLTAPSFVFGGGTYGSRVQSSTLTISGSGEFIVNGALSLDGTEGSTTGNNTVNLNGGTLEVPFITYTSGNNTTQAANIQFNGGTLEALSSDVGSGSLTFLPAIGGVSSKVDAGGAIINTGSFSDTIALVLGHGGTGTDGGLTKYGSGTLILASAGNAYNGLTTVNAGVLNINSEYALGGANYSGLTLNGGTLQYAATLLNALVDVTANSAAVTKPLTIGANGGTIDTNSNSVSFANGISGTGTFTYTDSNSSAGTLFLAGASTYTGATNVTGSGLLDVTGSIVNSGTINVISAGSSIPTLQLDGANALSSSAPITASTTGSALPVINVNANQALGAISSVGTINLNSGSIVTGTIDDPSTGQTSVLNVNSGANLSATHIRQGVLNIGSGSTVTIPSNPAGAYSPSSPAVSPTISVVNDLYNNGSSSSLTSGTLDLKNNALIVNDPNEASSIIAAVYNAADFNPSSGSNQWDQPGITSSSAQANASSYALGSLTGPELTNLGSTTFQGLPVTSNSTVVAYTLIGDTQLRGTVDGTDYNNVLANYDTAGDWSQGNFYNESIVSGDDYNAVLNAYDVAAAGGAKGLKPAITRSLSPALSPVATSGTFHLEVNTTSGDVVIFNDSTSSAPLTLYNIVDGSQQDLLIGNPADANGTSGSIESGSPPYTNEHFLSVAQNDSNAVASITGRSSTNYKAWSLVLDGYNSNATALALSEGGVANKTDTINVPSYYSIDLGDIFNVGTTTVALTFQWGTETSTGGEGGTVYSNQPIDYIGTPEPASLGLLGLGGLAMMRRRRKA